MELSRFVVAVLLALVAASLQGCSKCAGLDDPRKAVCDQCVKANDANPLLSDAAKKEANEECVEIASLGSLLQTNTTSAATVKVSLRGHEVKRHVQQNQQQSPMLRASSQLVKVPRPLARLAARAYHKNIVDHYESPRNVGSLNKADPNVGTGLVGAPACGDVMKLQMSVGEDGKVKEAVFKTFGCGSAIASSSYATEWLKGKTIDECAAIKNSDIASHLKLPPVKLHCSMLAEDAIKMAIKDYQSKQQKRDAVAAAAASAGSGS